MLYNICHGIFNFNGASWADKSDEAKDFITRLLCVDPAKRMTAREVGTPHRSHLGHVPPLDDVRVAQHHEHEPRRAGTRALLRANDGARGQ